MNRLRSIADERREVMNVESVASLRDQTDSRS
jgi:hypothetical protein